MSAADHLQVSRQHGLFNHHGIDLGDGTIAHYLEGREILRSSLEEFAKGSQFIVVSHKDSSSKRITLKRAISRIGEQDYNLLFNNCEHFANWCKTGFHKSPQIERFFRESLKASHFIKNLLPQTLSSRLDLILTRIIQDQEKISEDLQKINRSKNKLRKEIEIILNQVKEISAEEDSHRINSHNKMRNLILKGQIISDQLNFLNEVQNKMNKLLEEKKFNKLSPQIPYLTAE